jgi:hypothetical protein
VESASEVGKLNLVVYVYYFETLLQILT